MSENSNKIRTGNIILTESKEKKSETEKRYQINDLNRIGYKVVNSIGINEKNENQKESFLYKNLEVHQHLVIFDENEKKERIEDDSIECNII